MSTEKLLAPTAVKERRPPLDTAEAAIYTGTTANYLEKLRCTGGGPVYIKRKGARGAVRYDPDDLDAWLNAGKRKSTSDIREVA
ncbi:helix-turn-helix transcriptional regulator [Bradyrhizobium erythrophlei]|uniref:Helix-turn-helix domain-containing protein n=1 Tax=Bradyrhizobium erythrophlei TaxID=1437360 RepID=A0A1H4NGD3_9BRAD|nr:helix-turn-helix domain-containing protein [Bradyrhizobium erythrophlei]SEB94154.1 Helix-turn-helix domain-containing protein [Bradyrhizobium erythrophlei]